MNKLYAHTISSLLTLAAVSSIALGNSENSPTDRHFGLGSVSTYVENDLFVDSDSDYTSGIRLSYISPEVYASELPDWLSFLRPFSGDEKTYSFLEDVLKIDESDGKQIHYQFGVALTQLMFTPEDREALSAPPGERPYAGWLGLGLSLHAKTDRILNSVELTFGAVGPKSYARESQDAVHDFRSIPRFNGWDSQIPHEFTLNLHLTRRVREEFLSNAIDGFLEYGADFGNYRTAAYLGGVLRFGRHLPIDFSDPRISLTANAHTFRSDERKEPSWYSIYGLIGARGSLVAHDITLDGPVFRDFDTGTSSKPAVAEGYLGFGFKIKCLDVSYIYTYRTREFEDQLNSQDFGSVVVRLEI